MPIVQRFRQRLDQLNRGFVHCNPRHHSMAFIHWPGAPRKVQHVFFETNTLDDLGTAYDLCAERNIAATTIGRHPNDKAVSFYFRNPSRWFFEYGCHQGDGRQPATRPPGKDVMKSSKLAYVKFWVQLGSWNATV